MRAADCFCGAGGATCALTNAGFEVRLGIDWDERALMVYGANHSHQALKLDMSKEQLAVDAIKAHGPIDMISGSSPCQDYSCSGRRVEGTRAALTVSFARIACAVLPRLVLLENVPQLLLSDAYRYAKQLLVGSGYSILELHLNAAACGVPQVRRRVFVIAVRECDAVLLEKVKKEAASYTRTPSDARIVRDFLSSQATTYFLPARNAHVPLVRSTLMPAPTLTTGCLALPPSRGAQPRHDDVGALSSAHVLSIEDAAAIASFPRTYFAAVTSRTLAGRLIGNSVPPAMMAVVASWCMRLLSSPIVHGSGTLTQPQITHIVPLHSSKRRSRMNRLLSAGLDSHGARLEGNDLRYVLGMDTTGDKLVNNVIGWSPPAGWTLLLRERNGNSRCAKKAAPLDDLYLYQPGVEQPFRSCKQALRAVAAAQR